MVADVLNGALQHFQVNKSFRPLARVTQKGGGVVNGHDFGIAPVKPLAVLLGDFITLPYHAHSGNGRGDPQQKT